MTLPAGALAFLVLAASMLAAAVAARLLAEGGRPSTDDARVRAHAGAIGVVAAPFWAWAIVNNIEGEPDLGALTFAAALGASGYALLLDGSAPSGRCWRCAIGGACGAVAANYAIGVDVALKEGLSGLLVGYFVVGTLLWAAAAVSGVAVARDGGSGGGDDDRGSSSRRDDAAPAAPSRHSGKYDVLEE
jgi:hypothetical protein